MCLGLALMLSGVVVGGAYLYRYYILEVSSRAQRGRGGGGSSSDSGALNHVGSEPC